MQCPNVIFMNVFYTHEILIPLKNENILLYIYICSREFLPLPLYFVFKITPHIGLIDVQRQVKFKRIINFNERFTNVLKKKEEILIKYQKIR